MRHLSHNLDVDHPRGYIARMDPTTPKPVGRPRHYATPEAFDAMVDLYVQNCHSSNSPITVTGLALALGFYSRAELYNYRGYPEFSNSVSRALLLVENSYEARLLSASATGPIFALKNMGWSDRQELAHVSPDGTMTPRAAVDPTTIRAIAKQLDDEC